MSKHDSKAFGAQVAHIPHLNKKEIADLREDVDQGFIAAEARAGYPELDWLDGAGPVVAGGDIVLKGRNLLQGRTFDSLAVGTGTALLTFTMLKPGKSGYSVEIVDDGALSIVLTTKKVTVNVNAGVTTAAQVATEFNKAGGTMKGIMRCVDDGVAGAGTPAEAAEADLAGGVGEYDGFWAKVGGVACLPSHATGETPAATWGDTQVALTVPALTGKAAIDRVVVELACDGIQCKALAADCGQTALDVSAAAASAAAALVSETNAGLSEAAAAVSETNAANSAIAAAAVVPALKKRTSFPELDFIDGGAFAAAGAAGVVLKGRNLLGTKLFDELVTAVGTTAELTFTMLKPGVSGYSVEIVDTGALSVALAVKKVTVNIDAGVTTAAQIATEFNKAGGTMKGVMCCNDDGVAGAGTPAAAVEAPLAGGLGTYGEEQVLVGGVEALPAHATGTAVSAAWSNTGVNVDVPDLTASGMAASDVAAVVIEAGGVFTQQLSVTLA